MLRLTENFKHLFKSFLFLSCTLTLCPSAVISGDENSNKPILFSSSYQLGASNAIKIVSFYRGKGMVALGKFNKSPPVLFAERFELVVTSVMWHHAACVEDTKENSCYSSPREATVSAKDIFSVSNFFSLCLQEKLFHLQTFAETLEYHYQLFKYENKSKIQSWQSDSKPSVHIGLYSHL